jgi:hypothetical protein
MNFQGLIRQLHWHSLNGNVTSKMTMFNWGRVTSREYDSPLWFELRFMRSEKLRGIHRFFPCDMHEIKSADIIRFPLAYERVVLKKILFVRVVNIWVSFRFK